jgi:hypothetical protein
MFQGVRGGGQLTGALLTGLDVEDDPDHARKDDDTEPAKNISSPHRGTDGTSDRACASANNCAGRARDEKASSAAETRASQNRTATYP